MIPDRPPQKTKNVQKGTDNPLAHTKIHQLTFPCPIDRYPDGTHKSLKNKKSTKNGGSKKRLPVPIYSPPIEKSH